MNSSGVFVAKKEKISEMQPNTVILPYEPVEEFFVEELGELPKRPVYCAFKRILDIIISTCGLIVLLLPMTMIGIAVRCTSKGRALYFQSRLGKNGKEFQIIKFRTMRVSAEEEGAQWYGGEDDERVTRLGHFLRKTYLDELPQLFCILKGDMSLVGPRPEREIFYNEFEKYIHGFDERLKVTPGLTGLAQVSGGYNLRPEEKIVYDVEYMKTRSLWLDFKIMVKTVKVILSGAGMI